LNDHLLEGNDVPANLLIDYMWATIYIYRTAANFTPFQKRAFYSMINFERTEPLTTAELIKLHQIRYFLRLNSGTSLP